MRATPFSTLTPKFQRLYIFGAGGSGREVAWLAEQVWGAGVEIHFIVDNPKFLKDAINGIPMSLLSQITPGKNARYLIALGDPTQRERMAHLFATAGHQPAILVHPRTEISRWVEVGPGSIVCANCTVTCNVAIGSHVQVNVGCSISHDVAIKDYTTLSPGVNVSGNVHIGRGVFVGTNACFINGKPDKPLVIGDGAIVAAGACVIKDVPPNVLVAGVPANIKHKREN